MSSAKELFKEAEQLKREGKNEEAIAKFEEVLQLDDKHVLTHLSLAVLYGKVDKHLEAVKHGERAVGLEPNDTFNYTALSTTYQRAFEGTRDRRFILKAEEAKQRAHTMQWQ